MGTRRKPNLSWTLYTNTGDSAPRSFRWIYRNAHRVDGIAYTTLSNGSAVVTFFLDNGRMIFRGTYADPIVFLHWHAASRTFSHLTPFHSVVTWGAR